MEKDGREERKRREEGCERYESKAREKEKEKKDFSYILPQALKFYYTHQFYTVYFKSSLKVSMFKELSLT